jgi:hypothetical protein
MSGLRRFVPEYQYLFHQEYGTEFLLDDCSIPGCVITAAGCHMAELIGYYRSPRKYYFSHYKTRLPARRLVINTWVIQNVPVML